MIWIIEIQYPDKKVWEPTCITALTIKDARFCYRRVKYQAEKLYKSTPAKMPKYKMQRYDRIK